uniref:DZIP3-like HEPN domain-containing protein n=1 Tax=Ditylenchus dipsaci TaxID=166011 RepID=A0A915E0I1_9BILA
MLPASVVSGTGAASAADGTALPGLPWLSLLVPCVAQVGQNDFNEWFQVLAKIKHLWASGLLDLKKKNFTRNHMHMFHIEIASEIKECLSVQMSQEAQSAEDHRELLNHCYILQLCSEASRVLCKIFFQRWSHYSSLNVNILTEEWVNGNNHGQQLLQLLKPPAKMRDIFKEGNTDKWDVTVLCMAIDGVSRSINKLAKFDSSDVIHNYDLEDKFIALIRETRNQVSHCAIPKLSNDDFTKLWKQLDDALVELGEQPANLEEMKKLYSSSGEKKFDEEAAQLKAQADKYFQDKKYGEAISIYKEILKFESVGTEEQPIIYSNISACYLLLDTPEFIKKAVGYAKQCVMMRPTWWRGYYRLGRAQFEIAKLEKAKTSLTTALALNPTNKQVQVELSNVEYEIGKQVRQDDYQRALPTEEEQYEMVGNRLGISLADAKKDKKKLEKIPTIGDILHGHHYRDGSFGVKQDYAKAATYYAKAATGGNPEGMYNLALLYAKGLGVKRDMKISLMWLKKAAEMPTNTMFGRLGIAEAQHSLGLRYQTGVGVPKDLKLAIEWYQKAVDNNCAASANNLGLLYQNGTGVKRSLETAFMHFKMAAQQDDVPAMINLSSCYFGARGTGSIFPLDEDIQQGMVWLQRAASLGNLQAANKLEQLKQSPKAIHDLRVQSLFPIIPPEADLLNYQEHVGVSAQNLEHMKSAMTAFKNHDHATLVAELSAAIHLDQQNVKIPELFHGAIDERMISHPDELEVNTCYVHLNTRGSRKGRLGNRLDSVMAKFPSDPFFLEMAIMTHTFQLNFEKALELVELLLKLYKTLADTAYYIKATIYARMDEPSKREREEMNKSFDAFLSVAAKDHPKVPCAHYRKAVYHLGNNDDQQFVACYEAGLAAEDHQLPCFLPINFDPKYKLEKVYSMFKAQSVPGNTKNKFSECSTSKLLLSDPHRRLLLVKSRQLFVDMEDIKYPFTLVTFASPLLSAQPPSLVSLKPIALRDMDATKDHVYDGYVLQLKIIDWPHKIKAVFLQVSDETDSVQKMAIYNWPNKENQQELMKTFSPNRTLSLINPHMRIALDGESILHVQSPAHIVLAAVNWLDIALNTVKNMIGLSLDTS